MPVRTPAILLILSLFLAAVIAAVPEPARAGGPKVAIIVGPVGGLTSTYRSMADDVADAASAAGATVAKAYSPTATWGNVRNAVDGANVVVYFGHGNGYPNPYTIGHQYTDRVNGWGVNRTTTNGDSDSWSSTMVYCGEKALLGTLTSSDGAAQRQYCTGKVNPAPGFTMVYAQAHYAPGFGERYVESTPLTTLAEAQQRVRNYSRPVFGLGGSAFYATAYGDADEIVTRLLTDGRTHGDLFRSGRGFSAGTLTTMAHPDVPGTAVWVQRTSISGLHFGDPDYWYAFAGNPDTTAAEGFVPLPFSDIASSPFRNDIVWLAETGITGGCGNGRFCPDQAVTREQMASFLVRALDLPATGTDYFTDDGSSIHHADINRLAASGITGGCDDGRFCPRNVVTREQMASFLVRALDLPATGTDYFTDDGSSIHEADINRLAASGITGGCGGSRFCPAAGVTRGQMAAFLRRGLS